MRIVTLTISLFLIASLPSLTQEQAALQKGLNLKKEGKYLEALSTWEKARATLKDASLPIAREHIQLVTEQNMRDAYQVASEMYLWGLSSTSTDEEELEKEMGMIQPIVEPDIYKNWEEDFKKNPESILPLIAQYWTAKDITPDTPYNELLLEHWERIAYVRENFLQNDNTIYGTDDRGITWIQYGKPDRIESGIFSLLGSDIEQTVILRLETNLPGRGDNHLKQNETRAQEDRIFAREIANDVERFAVDRDYEIWIYDDHNISSSYKHTIMFGNTAVKGFANALSIYDFIPASAASFKNRSASDAIAAADNSSVTANETAYQMAPAVFMQLEYLRQIASIDPKFARQFSELRSTIFKAGEAPRRDEALQFKRQHDQAALLDKSKAPVEVSTYLDEFPSIPVQLFTYRFLDHANNPYSIVYLQSEPQGTFILDETHNSEVMKQNKESAHAYYDFTHGLQIRNSEQRLLASQELRPDINIDIEIKSPPSISIFQVPYVSDDTWEVYYAQLKNNHPETKPEVESPFPNEVRGIGTIKRQQQEPLSKDTKTLELSDAILGYDMDTEDDGSTFIPFTASHSKKIAQGKNLVLHYELYHLTQDDNGIANFQAEFEIIEKRTGLNRLRRNGRDFTLTLNQQSDQSFFKENLEVDISQLETGAYILRMSVTDTASNEQLDKDIEFSITEN